MGESVTRGYRFARPVGTALCYLDGGRVVELPVFPGVLKNPDPETLKSLLSDPEVALRYTKVALEKAVWQVLKQFPPDWLRQCLEVAELSPGRRDALTYLLA